jgi:hypothetical protein
MMTTMMMILMMKFQSVNIEVERVMIGDGSEFAVEDALHQADKSDRWVIIQGLHLAPQEFFVTLRHHLQRIHKSRGQHVVYSISFECVRECVL